MIGGVTHGGATRGTEWIAAPLGPRENLDLKTNLGKRAKFGAHDWANHKTGPSLGAKQFKIQNK